MMIQTVITSKKYSRPIGPALLLLIAVIMAIFFLFFQLDQIPPGFTFDEASHALDALDILNGKLMLISPRLEETPAGYMYFVAAAFKLFGASILVQRAVSATFGVFLVIINFFAVRTLFKQVSGQQSIWIATFSTLLLSTSFWVIITSRKGFEYIVPPCFALLAILFFWQGYRSEHWGRLLLSAFFTTIGFYIYNGAGAFLPVIPTTLFLSLILYHLGFIKTAPVSWRLFLFYSAAVSVFALPMFLKLTSGENPEVERSLSLLVFNKANTPFEGIQLLFTNMVAYAQPFLALDGDHRWYSNLPGRPILNPILALSFLAGIAISLTRFKQLSYLLILVYWAGTIAPAVLTFAGSEISAFHFRMAGSLPATYIFIALAWANLYLWLIHLLNSDWSSKWVKILFPYLALSPFLFISLIWLPYTTYRDYFVTWASRPEVKVAHDVPLITIVDRMAQETAPDAIFILPRDARVPRSNYIIDFLYHGQTPLRYSVFDPDTIHQTLTSDLAGYQTVHWITKLTGARERLQHRATSHELLRFLFDRYGQLINTEETDGYTLLTYRLVSSQVDFSSHLNHSIPPDFEQLDLVIGEQVQLAGVKKNLLNDQLYIDLAWRGLVYPYTIKADYTIFIQLLDQKGQRIAGVDELPETGFTMLDRGELKTTSHIIPLAEVPPGTYTLLIGLYYIDGDELINVGSVTLKPDFIR